MTLEDLADLIRANSANLNRRTEQLHAESYGQLLNLTNDMTDLRSQMAGLRADVGEVRRSLDLAGVVSDMKRQIERLEAEVAALKQSA